MRSRAIVVLIAIFIATLSCSEDNKEPVVFKVALGAEPVSLDAHLCDDYVGVQIVSELFEGILKGEPRTGGYRSGLAKSWDVSLDETVYTFHLREGLVWSDGVPITAEGIRKSYIRVLDKDLGASNVDMIKSSIKNAEEYFNGLVGEVDLGIKAIDNMTLEITLVHPKPYFLDMLVHQVFVPVPVHAVERYGNKWTEPENIVVSGPFKLKDKIFNEAVVLEKNPMYYNSEKIVLDKLVFVTVRDAMDIYDMYQNDEIDAILNSVAIPSQLIRDIKLRDDYYSSDIHSVYFYSLNTKVKPLDDVRVRQALSLAINRRTLVYNVLENGAKPTRRIASNYKNYTYGRKLFLYSPKKAKKLLAEAGYPNGRRFPNIKIKYNKNEIHQTVAEFVQNSWKKALNIDIDLEIEEGINYIKDLKNGNYNISNNVSLVGYADPRYFLNMFTTNNSQLSSYGYSNSKYDELVKQSDLEKDIVKRQAILRRAEAIIVEDDFPVIPIYTYVGNYLFKNSKWAGWFPNGSERFSLSEIIPVE
ncbi:peptide ABC transporter substrate-binding protein [Candidatus Borreliella tachyglossi]|uniref:peptide ABC transporter substrate-binding protein n=1 Tax=Candidatus Borreliella tachyglossi TaxID=1964448 RepID=UPI0040434DBF